MVTEDPYTEDDMRELDPELGPIKINSSVFRSEYIMVKKYHETANVPLWVSAYRRPFRQANFGRNMQQAVSLSISVLIPNMQESHHLYLYWGHEAQAHHGDRGTRHLPLL